MVFPPRFGMASIPQTTFVPVYGAPPMMSMVPGAQYLMQTMQGGVIASMGPRSMGGVRQPRPLMQPLEQPRFSGNVPYEKPPATTVFVGNIHEKASNELVKAILAHCGNIIQWKRVQGPNNRFQAFGFCEYDHPDSTLRAVRILHNWKLGDKQLVVKVDEKTKETLRGYINKRRQQQGKPLLNVDEQIPCDDDMRREDEAVRNALQTTITDLGPDLLDETGASGNRKSPELTGKGGNLDIESLDRDRKEYIAREISIFRQAHKDEKGKHKREDGRSGESSSRSSRKKDRSVSPPQQPPPVQAKSRVDSRSPTTSRRSAARSSSPESATAASMRSASRGRTRTSKYVENVDTSSRSASRIQKRSRSRSRSESDEENTAERRRLERYVREKEAAYKERLKKWEMRFRKKAREYENERLKQKQIRREELREAKKLKEFLEDYDDERDDPKFYRGKNNELRRREYERERESDAKDRQKEKEEFEEIKRKLLEEGVADPEEEIAKIRKEEEEKLAKRLNGGDSSESPSPIHMQRQAGSDNEGATSEGEYDGSGSEEGERKSRNRRNRRSKEDAKKQVRTSDIQSPDVARVLTNSTNQATVKPMGFVGLKLTSTTTSAVGPRPGDSLVDDDEDMSSEKAKSRRLVPLEYTEEEKAAVDGLTSKSKSLSADEKRKLVKSLIDKIPTVKEDLFAYTISWSLVDQSLVDRRLKPWVNRKIVEYIGEEEPSLVEFICQQITQNSTPDTIVDAISMVLDDEATVFVIKLWRLLIYEIEAKKLGLVKSESSS